MCFWVERGLHRRRRWRLPHAAASPVSLWSEKTSEIVEQLWLWGERERSTTNEPIFSKTRVKYPCLAQCMSDKCRSGGRKWLWLTVGQPVASVWTSHDPLPCSLIKFVHHCWPSQIFGSDGRGHIAWGQWSWLGSTGFPFGFGPPIWDEIASGYLNPYAILQCAKHGLCSMLSPFFLLIFIFFHPFFFSLM